MIYSKSRKPGSSAGTARETAMNMVTVSFPVPTLPTVTPSFRQPMTEPATKGLGTNYEEPAGKGEMVTESSSGAETTAVPAQSQVQTDGLFFPEELYPYRAMLTEEQQGVYDAVYVAANARSRQCALDDYTISEEGLSNVMTAIYNDHPELFWLDKQYTYSYIGSGRIVSLRLEFNETAGSYENARANFNKAAKEIIDGASSLETDEEKEKYVYNAIMDSTQYNENAILNQSAYSALVNKTSVCAGYSRAFQYILQQLGIPCYFCSGYAKGGNHAWNIVKLGDRYVNVDISWDDSVGELKNGYTYEYFNATDEEFAVDHTRRGMSVKLPACK